MDKIATKTDADARFSEMRSQHDALAEISDLEHLTQRIDELGAVLARDPGAWRIAALRDGYMAVLEHCMGIVDEALLIETMAGVEDDAGAHVKKRQESSR